MHFQLQLWSTFFEGKVRLMREAGVPDTNPGHPALLALLAAGCTDAEFSGAAATATARIKGFAYALGTLTRQREDAAKTVLHAGPMAATRKDRQLSAAALMTGAAGHHHPQLQHQPETIDASDYASFARIVG